MTNNRKTLLQILALTLIYSITAKLGLKLNSVGGFATLVWAPSGISLAALLLLDKRLWPGISLGAFFINWYLGAPIAVAFCIASGNTLEAVIGANFLRRLEFRCSLERLRDVLALVFIAALLSTLVSATLGTAALTLAGIIPRSTFGLAWRTWWLGDIMGDLVVAPFLMVWYSKSTTIKKTYPALEFAALALILTLSSVVIFSDLFFQGNALFPRPYVMFPILMTIALRLGQRGLATANLAVSALAIQMTVMGHGRFWNGSLTESLLLLQFFLAVLIVSNLILAAITAERRKEREAFQKSTIQREAILNAALDCIITIDHHGRIIEFNPAAQKTFGYSVKEVMGKQIEDLIIPPHLREAHKKGLAHFCKTGEGPVLGKKIELAGMRSDGTQFPVEISIQPLRTSGPPMFTGFIQDITERKQAETDKKKQEESDRFLAESTELLSASIDYRTTLLHVAQSVVPRLADWCVVHIFGEEKTFQAVESACSMPEKEGLLKELIAKYLSNPDNPTTLASVFKTKKSKLIEETSDEINRSISKDDRHFELLKLLDFKSLIVCPLLSQGKPLGAISVATALPGCNYGKQDLALFEELARRASIAIENARLYQKAQEAISARDEFLSIASHELKTPLTSLFLQLQLYNRNLKRALQNLGTETESATVTLPIKTALNILNSEKQCLKLSGLLDELLDLTRIRLGKLQLEKENVDLSVVLSEVVERFKAEAIQKGIPITVHADPAAQGNWDRIRIEQIVNNLISNALKYGEAKPISISVKKNRANQSIEFAVQDQGMGIPEEMREKVFERFERAGVTGQKIAGLGLGLYICRQIVEAHGGTIHAESNQGKGSIFTVILPVNHSEKNSPANPYHEARES